jgi:hypothetical protein
MPLVQTRGAASAQGFGEFAQVTAVNYIEDVFSTWLYTGNSTSGGTQTITNNIDLSTKGGLVWIKGRSAASNHIWTDTSRGVGTSASNNQALSSNLTTAEDLAASYDFLSAFNTTGFAVTQGGTSTATRGTNYNAVTYVSWTFRKQPKFFDVVTFTGTGANRTIAHSLGSVPGSIIVKRTDTTAAWAVYHRSLANTQYMVLNTTAAAATGATWWNSTTPTSSVFSVGTDASVNASGGTYVAYIFAHDAGGFGLTGTDNVISCGSVTDNNRVELGYEPQFLLLKTTSTTGNWILVDTMRGLTVDTSDGNATLFPNTSGAEASGSRYANIDATGFTSNMGSPGTHIYIAIRRGPMKVPTSGTSVFEPLSRAGTSSLTTISSGSVGPVDTIMAQSRDVVNGMRAWDRLRSVTNWLGTYSTQAETAASGSVVGFDSMTGVRVNDGSNEVINTNSVASPYINYMFKRAPSFFDEVCYTGTGTTQTITHNLQAVPELIITKNRTTTGPISQNWCVYAPGIPNNNNVLLVNENYAWYDVGAAMWNGTPTSTTFGVAALLSPSADKMVAYLFATCAGVSKVGSYTGTATTKQIDCGFTAGSRFVLIKRTDSTGDWYVWDSARGIVAGNDPYLLLNSTAAEVTSTDYVDTYSAGFELSSTAPAAINANAGTYIFLAIA